jgi:hypothetical protein
MSDLKVYALVQSTDSCLYNHLKMLADSADGPLRVTIKDNVPYIGIRDWPTYFFEKITCAFNLDSLKNIEKETIEDIQIHVSPIVEANSGPGHPSPHMLLHKLCARTSENSLKPDLGSRAFLNASTTEPKYKTFEVTNATIRVVDGMMIVPKGLTITVKETENVMADCHLVTNTNNKPVSGIDRSPASGTNKPGFDYAIPKKALSFLNGAGTALTEQKWYEHYYQNLTSNTNSVHTCVAVEVFPDTALGSSKLNLNGAVRAADKFMDERKSAGKPVSISLSVKHNLQAVTEKPCIDLSDWLSTKQDSPEKFITLYMPELAIPETSKAEGTSAGAAFQLAAGVDDTNDEPEKVYSGSGSYRTEVSSDSDTEYSSDEEYFDLFSDDGQFDAPTTSGKKGHISFKEKFGRCVDSDGEDDDENAPPIR